jgi:hypothetical protein
MASKLAAIKLCHKISSKLRNNMRAFCEMRKIQQNIIDINKIFEQQFLSSSKSENKVRVNNCDEFKACKIFVIKETDSKTDSSTDENNKKLFKCVWPQCRYNTNRKRNI